MDIRVRVLGALVAALVIGALVAAPGFASAEEAPLSASPSPEASLLSNESCESGFTCVWNATFYQAERQSVLCTGGTHNVGHQLSAKNRCANKGAWLREGGVAHYCVNPGNNIPGAEFTEVWIGAEGSRC